MSSINENRGSRLAGAGIILFLVIWAFIWIRQPSPLIPLVIQDSTTDTIMTITADGRIIGHDGRTIGQLDEHEIEALLR